MGLASATFRLMYLNSFKFSLENKIQINETGLSNPAFNQRSPFIELVDEGKIFKLTSEGIEGAVK